MSPSAPRLKTVLRPGRSHFGLPVLLGAFLIGLALLLAGEARAEDEGRDRDVEPIARLRVFSQDEADRLDPVTSRQIRKVIGRSFASLGDIGPGREILVRRFGLRSAPEINVILRGARNVTPVWNATLTVAALRDVSGASPELLPSLKPLLKILESQSDEAHMPAFAALALGSFPWPESTLPAAHRKRLGYYEAVPGVSRRIEEATDTLRAARRALITRVGDKLAFTSMAALFALAKSGGDAAHDGLFDRPLGPFANTGPERALLLTRAFLSYRDGRAFRDGLRDEDRRVRAAAALAMAVAMLQERPVEWTRDAETIVRRLKGFEKGILINKDRADGAEAVFARGVCAFQNQANEEWKEIWKTATRASSKHATTEAASQALLFCDLPWFRRDVVKWAASAPVMVDDPVRAMLLLRAAALGTDDSLSAVKRWLHNKGLRPSADHRWDPRWYAVVGLLRVLHAGGLTGPGQRQRAVAMLRYTAAQVLDRRAPLRAALKLVLEQHGDQLASADATHAYRLPRAALRRVERSFTCPHGLLASDPIDACVKRVNDMVYGAFGLDGLAKSKPGVIDKQPERYLKRALLAYPYFSRLQFRHERGFRRRGRMYEGDFSKGIDR